MLAFHETVGYPDTTKGRYIDDRLKLLRLIPGGLRQPLRRSRYVGARDAGQDAIGFKGGPHRLPRGSGPQATGRRKGAVPDRF